MVTRRRPARKKLAGGARRKRSVKKQSGTAPKGSDGGVKKAPGKQRGKRAKRPAELSVIDKVLGRYKKQIKDDDFRVTTAEVTKLIQLKKELGGIAEEFGEVDLRFTEVPCLDSESGS